MDDSDFDKAFEEIGSDPELFDILTQPSQINLSQQVRPQPTSFQPQSYLPPNEPQTRAPKPGPVSSFDKFYSQSLTQSGNKTELKRNSSLDKTKIDVKHERNEVLNALSGRRT